MSQSTTTVVPAALVFDKLMRASDFCQRDALADVEARPTRFERGVQIPCCLRFRFRKIVAAEKEHTNVLKYHLSEGNFRSGIIRGVARNRSVELQEFNVGLDIGSKRDLNNVINALRSERSYACNQ